MDWSSVETILASLPNSFKRNGPNYITWQNTQTAALSRMTTAFDDITAQATFLEATGGWLNAWGELLGVLRSTEYDALYQQSITGTLTAWRATPVGIQKYLTVARGIPCTVIERFPLVGWQLVINPGITLTSQEEIALPGWLAFVRPAGVPYTVNMAGVNGGFLSTGNFLKATKFPSSWLRSSSNNGALTIPTATNNSVCTLPTTLFTDPTLNPSLAS